VTRAVLDTNVLLSGILFSGPVRNLLRRVVAGEFRFVTSAHLLDEFEDLLVRRFGFSRAAAIETRAELEAIAEIVEPTSIPSVCRDPDDNHVLAAAASGKVDLIITGDRDLLDLGEYEGIKIVVPTDVGS
jgi:putative PIN family toxin of toxin-antitoxin system